MSSYRRSGKRSRGYVRARSSRRSRRPTRRMALRRGRGFVRRAGVYGRFLSTPRSELKCFDVNRVQVIDATTTLEDPDVGYRRSLLGSALPTDGITQGSNAGERIGNKIVVKSIHVELAYTVTAGTIANSSLVCFIVYDKQPNGGLAAATDMFALMIKGVQTASTSPATCGAFPNLFNSGRFVTLARADFVPTVGYSGFNASIQKRNIYKKVNLPVEYNGTTGVESQIMKGNIILVAFSGGAGNELEFASRIRYSDV